MSNWPGESIGDEIGDLPRRGRQVRALDGRRGDDGLVSSRPSPRGPAEARQSAPPGLPRSLSTADRDRFEISEAFHEIDRSECECPGCGTTNYRLLLITFADCHELRDLEDAADFTANDYDGALIGTMVCFDEPDFDMRRYLQALAWASPQPPAARHQVA